MMVSRRLGSPIKKPVPCPPHGARYCLPTVGGAISASSTPSGRPARMPDRCEVVTAWYASLLNCSAANFQLQGMRSEEHTSELQSLMRTSYADFCLKKKIINKNYRASFNIYYHHHQYQLLIHITIS